MLLCGHCKEVELRGRQRRFCSPTCHQGYLISQKTTAVCAHCREIFPQKFSKRARRHCSRACRIAARRTAQAPEPVEGCCWIPLTHGKFTLVDVDDAERLRKHTWSCTPKGYARTGINGREIKLHQLLLGLLPAGMEPDHISRDRLDNRRVNLRVVTRSEQAINRGIPKNNTSGFKGVFRDRYTWRAAIAGKHVGVFETAEEAARAYDVAAYERYGDVAVLNFPEEDQKLVR